MGFILGMEDGKGLGFVLGAQPVLLARHGVLAVVNTRPLEQDESLNRETSPVSPRIMNASSGEFPRSSGK